MRFTQVLFDLDGTLTESGRGICASVAWTLETLGYPLPSGEELLRFVGPPLNDSFRRLCGMTPEEAARAVEVFRGHYRRTGILDAPAYPGIHRLLETLRKNGVLLGVATSKPEEQARTVLENGGLIGFFSHVSASRPEWETSKPVHGDIKQIVIEDALASMPERDRSLVAMVGDRRYDMVNAVLCGVCPIGVTYGYGSRRELTDAGALALADTPLDLERILLGQAGKGSGDAGEDTDRMS